MTTAILIGDSQAGGVAPTISTALRAKGVTLLREYHRNGAGTAGLIEHLSEEVVGPGVLPVPNVAIVMAGGNDSPSSSPVWANMISRLRTAGVRSVVWIGPPTSPDPGLDARRNAITEAQRAFFATQPGVRYISGRELAAGLPHVDERGEADVHLTTAAYRVYAQRIASLFSSSGGVMIVGAAIAAGVLWFSWKAADRAAYGPRRRRR